MVILSYLNKSSTIKRYLRYLGALLSAFLLIVVLGCTTGQRCVREPYKSSYTPTIQYYYIIDSKGNTSHGWVIVNK